ncbi:MAG: hypothetical protein RLZZ507_114 [Cyanobacteriota bacterium]|jgi:S1-C subfamily serine protease
MNLKKRIPKIVSSAGLVSTIFLMMPKIVVALPGSEVSKIAEQITVLIDGQNPGSGVIIGRKEKSYYVLTAKHVVETQDEYTVQTSDGSRYQLNYSTVKKLPNVDLAVLQFTSNKNYNVAKLADSDQVGVGVSVYIAGFPNPGREITQRIYQFTNGEVSGRPKPALRDGYAIVYTNVTRAGMSGGPVLDANGRVVGIHGRAESESVPTNESGTSVSKLGFNLGIPINTFLNLANKVGVNLGVQAEKSPVVTQTKPPTTVSSPVSEPSSTPSFSPGTIPRRPTPIRPTNLPQAPVCAGSKC